MTDDSFRSRFLVALDDPLAGDLDDTAREQLLDHCLRVRERNSVMNLTRIVEPEEMVRKHVIDSLAARRWLDKLSPTVIVDLGTGAGWPGVSLAIALPTHRYRLVDSTRKKIEFVDELITALRIEDRARAQWLRFGEPKMDRSLLDDADVITARAVGPISRVVDWIPSSYRGRVVLWKGPAVDDELKSARQVLERGKWKIGERFHYTLGGDAVVRHIVILKRA